LKLHSLASILEKLRKTKNEKMFCAVLLVLGLILVGQVMASETVSYKGTYSWNFSAIFYIR
jgi:hypothetical protein